MEYKLQNVIAERRNKVIYRDNDAVIKVFDESFKISDILNEALNQARVSETEINVPKVREVLKIDGKWAIVSDFVEGTTMSELAISQPERFDELMQMFVKLQIYVHSIKCPLLNKHEDKMNRKICEADIDAGTRYELLTRLNSLPKRYSICHGDFNPANVIITPDNTPYIIDWSHVTQGDPAADVARTYLIFSLKSGEETAKKYLKSFCEATGMDAGNVFQWLPVVACSQSVKKRPEERELLLKWVNVVDYQ